MNKQKMPINFTNKDRGINSIKGLVNKKTGKPLTNIEYHCLAAVLFEDMESRHTSDRIPVNYEGYSKEFVELSKKVKEMVNENISDIEINSYISSCVLLPNGG